RPPPRPGLTAIGLYDSTTLILLSFEPFTFDTVGSVRRVPARVDARYSADGKLSSTTTRFNPLAVGEKFLLFADGSLAIARLDPYRVDWRSPNGKWTFGPP